MDRLKLVNLDTPCSLRVLRIDSLHFVADVLKATNQSINQSIIYLLIKVYKYTNATRQVKPSRTARLTGALTAALKTIKTV